MNIISDICRPTPRVCIRLLADEIRVKPHRLTRHAKIFIVGIRQTGKKTLARRFGAMNHGPFQEEIPSRYFYRAFFNLDNRATVDGTGDVFLTIYLIPPPSDMPVQLPDLYFEEMYFNAMLFLCSVIDIESFQKIVEIINENYLSGLPYFIVVGNKKDLDREMSPHHFTANFASGVIGHFATSYFECSARENIDVNPILDDILQSIVDAVPDDE